jgi:hypothetical protein
MARIYHIDVAAFAANAERKWVDNLVSHFDVDGVECARRGIARRITTDGLYRIALIRRLNAEAGISIAQAVRLADRLLAPSERPDSAVTIGEGLELAFNRVDFETAIDVRIAEAVETFRPAPRGRPPAQGRNFERPEA